MSLCHVGSCSRSVKKGQKERIQNMKFNALKIMKYISLVVFLGVFAASAGRCESHIKGEIQRFSDNMVVAQVLKGGVLLWSLNDIVNHRKSWQDANDLIFLRLKNTRGIQKGEGFRGVWLKYRGTYRHGNLLVGYRDIPAFELPSKEEVKLAQYAEAQRREKAERLRQAEERRRAQQQADEERRIEILRHEQDLRQRIEDDKRQKQMIEEEARRREEEDRQREEEARRAEDDRRRRYPIEQKERAEYAEVMLSKISFDIGSYFDIQNDLKRYIASMSVTEKKWENLKELQLKNDWLGMLRVAAGNEMKDYPDQSQIAAIIENLKNARFHLETLFTHKPEFSDRIRVGWVRLEDISYDFSNPGYWDGVEDFEKDKAGLIVTFSMAASEKRRPLLYAPESSPRAREVFDRRRSQLSKIHSDVKYGKISGDEANRQQDRVEEEFKLGIASWIEVSRIGAGVFGERVRESQSNIGSEKSGEKPMGAKTVQPPKQVWVTCPDCEGKRRFSTKCTECRGEGVYYTDSSRGIGGRVMGGKKRRCNKCNGTGEMKVDCEKCHGLGKIRQ